MGRQSTIKQLPDGIREEVDRMVRDDGWTIDEITDRIQELGGDASRSAVGRYVKSAREQMEKYRQAQEVSKVWVKKLEEEPNGDVGRLLIEMLRTVSFTTISNMGDDDDGATPNDLMMLARAIKDMTSADKTALDRELRARREVARQAAEEVGKLGEELGWNNDQVKAAREKMLGIVA